MQREQLGSPRWQQIALPDAGQIFLSGQWNRYTGVAFPLFWSCLVKSFDQFREGHFA
jgi:hypothetical protein